MTDKNKCYVCKEHKDHIHICALPSYKIIDDKKIYNKELFRWFDSKIKVIRICDDCYPKFCDKLDQLIENWGE